MGKIDSFEELYSWQKARYLTKDIYKETSDGMISHDYGLRNQIRKASVFNDLYQRSIEISRLISGLIDYLKKSENKGRKFK